MIKVISMIVTIAFLACYSFFLPRLLIKKDLKSLEIITFEFFVQNFVCIMASNVFSPLLMQLIIIYKEIILWGAVFIQFVFNCHLKLSKKTIPAIVMVIICISYMFIGHASIFTKLVCLRQILTPFILILYGNNLRISYDEFKKYLRFVVNLGVFQALFGLLERFVLGDTFWQLIKIENYMHNKGFSQWLYGNNLPGNFYSADLFSSFGLLRRLVGFSADPLLTGHFLAFCVIILLFINVYKTQIMRYTTLILLSLTILLTLSKGSILVVAIAYFYKLWKKNKIYGILLLIPIFGFLYYIIKENVFYTLTNHLGGMKYGIVNNILGSGLGTAGNYANLYDNAGSDAAESYIAALSAQTGLIGFGAFLYAFYNWIKKITRINRNKISYLVIAYTLAIIIESFMAESAINYIGSGVALISFGIVISNRMNE